MGCHRSKRIFNCRPSGPMLLSDQQEKYSSNDNDSDNTDTEGRKLLLEV
jgi:hypothetical protein